MALECCDLSQLFRVADLSAALGAPRESAMPAFDGDKSPAESGDKSPHSKSRTPISLLSRYYGRKLVM
jgi:hypothetical protein